MRVLPLAIVLTLACGAMPALAAQPLVEVDTCGQVVPDRTVGYLAADLDCTGFEGGPSNVDPLSLGAAVYLGRNSRLDLRGRTLTGGRSGVLCNAVDCDSRSCSRGTCEVFGGTIVGSATGVQGQGVGGSKPYVHDVTVSGFHVGVYGGAKTRVVNATVSDAAIDGVRGSGVQIAGSTITGAGQFGINAWSTRSRLKLTTSTVIGNGVDAETCFASPCADLLLVRPPRLKDSTCERSVAPSPIVSFGVCSLD